MTSRSPLTPVSTSCGSTVTSRGPELYEAADELGMLVWQDMPLQWGYARSVGRQAARQAAEAVDLLGHHPSVAIWCGHNEPIAIDVRPGEPVNTRRIAIDLVAGQELPSWNRSILDARIKRTFERADGTRPVIAHSGVAPHLPQLDGTDSHLYFGWYHGRRARPARLRRRVAAAWCASSASSARRPFRPTPSSWRPEHWPDLDWDHLQRRHTLQKRVFDERVPPDELRHVRRRGRTPPSGTRPAYSATTSRPCGG